MTIQFMSVVPILRIFDIAKADEFYQGFLGFKVDWDHRFDDSAPLYRQVSRGDLALHLSEHHGDGSPGARLRVMMGGVEDALGHAGDRRDRPVRESDPLLRADRRAVILTAKDHVPRHEITRRARFFRHLRSIAHAAPPTLAFSRRAASTSKAVPFNEVRKAPSRGPEGTIMGLASFGPGLGSGEHRACR
jgi:catechol 2,3-dioxygenase-like lactoylglutathione lyase family enzyme